MTPLMWFWFHVRQCPGLCYVYVLRQTTSCEPFCTVTGLCCEWCKISCLPPAKISGQRFPSSTETIISSYKVQADKTTLSSSIPQIRDEFEESNAASYREDSVCGERFSHIFLNSYRSATALWYFFDLNKCCSFRIMNSHLSIGVIHKESIATDIWQSGVEVA